MTSQLTREACLAKAEECEKRALSTVDRKAQESLRQAAAEWRKLAETRAPRSS